MHDRENDHCGVAAEHHHQESAAAGGYFASVTLNPELRLSVARDYAFDVPHLKNGTEIRLPVQLVNEAMATPRLGVQVNSEGFPALDATLSLITNGSEWEEGVLTLLPQCAGTWDISLAFSCGSEPPDLGERNVIHLLVNVTN